MLSLFFKKGKVKKKCFHSFSRSEKGNQNASRLRSRSENSRDFFAILEKRDLRKIYSVKAKKARGGAIIGIFIASQF